jgi:ABC-type uncharacterized transport system ATPase subunit
VELRGEDGATVLPAATSGLAVTWERKGPGLYEGEFLKNETSPAEVVRRVVTDVPVHDLTVLEPPIEEVVQKIYLGEIELS